MQPAVLEVLKSAGYRPADLTLDLVRDAETALGEAVQQPHAVVGRMLKARRECARASSAASELQAILEALLQGGTLLCQAEALRETATGRWLAVWMRGELHELAVHPSVVVDELRRIEPWHLVRVHVKEHVVVGVDAEPATFARAHGEVVELRDWHDRDRGQVVVARAGGEQQVVRLAHALRGAALRPRDRLVLARGGAGWAIARAASDSGCSRFEQPIDASVVVEPDQVAGLEAVLEPLLEQVELRLLRPELRARFGLEPLHGILLWSLLPGTGKTLLTRLLATWLRRAGELLDTEVVLYVVKPNELKNSLHGEDARLVRDELCGGIRARQQQPRTKRLLQLVVFDEVDSLGRRAGGHDGVPLLSSAHNDAIQALLVELDGMQRLACDPPAHVLWLGLTNRPDAVDPALKRPGRFGDLVLEMPELTAEAAVAVMLVYAPQQLGWVLGSGVRSRAFPAGVDRAELGAAVLLPAVRAVFATTVLRYASDAAASTDVAAARLLTAVHCREAMNAAKLRAARRSRAGGLEALTYDDVLAGLLDQAAAAARAMEADWLTLQRCLRVRGRIQRVDLVPAAEVAWHQDLQPAVSA